MDILATAIYNWNDRELSNSEMEVVVHSTFEIYRANTGLPTFQNAKEEYFEEILPKKRNA